MKTVLLPLIAFVACYGAASADDTKPAAPAKEAPAADLWQTDFAKAQKTARTEKKALLIFFTGSDWCGWCMKLDKQILGTEAFKTWATKNAVLVKADFPKKTKLPADVAKQNDKLQSKYGISGFPTIVVLDRHGARRGETGYKDMTPDEYVKDLEGIISGKKPKKAK